MSAGKNRIGPYQVLRLISSGSTTQVCEGKQSGREGKIALKVLMQKFATDKKEIHALKHEANVGADLKHPNIIEIYNYTDEHTLPLIAMELFPARNLKIECRENRLLVNQHLMSIMRNCAKSLAHMHDSGWVHCDIKPDNFLFNKDGELKLIDVSISVPLKKPGGLRGLFGGKPKHVRGTRSYMSPEQIRREHPDPRSDVYGLGCVLFELIAGRLPYSATSPDALLKKHLNSKIPSLEAYAGVTKEFADLIKKMLAKKAEDRVQSMAEFVHLLDRTKVFLPGKRPEGFRR